MARVWASWKEVGGVVLMYNQRPDPLPFSTPRCQSLLGALPLVAGGLAAAAASWCHVVHVGVLKDIRFWPLPCSCPTYPRRQS